MRYFYVLALIIFATTSAAGEKLYKCVDSEGKVEYSNRACKGKPQEFDPSKSRGSVTNMKLPGTETGGKKN
ncbi:MAG: DUF4124 domain-containing protein [Burkholderiales bacterium]